MLLQTPARSSIDPKFLFSEDPSKYSPLFDVWRTTCRRETNPSDQLIEYFNFKPLKLSSQDVRQVIISEESRQENENVQRFIQIPA